MAHSRTHLRTRRKRLASNTRTVIRPGLKVVALVSILGISAYLLFTREDAEHQRVDARQVAPATIPQTAVHSDPIPDPAFQPVRGDTRSASAEPGGDPLVGSIPGLAGALGKASPEVRRTAGQLLEFASNGRMSSVRDLTDEDVQALMEFLSNELGETVVASGLESLLGLPAQYWTAYGNPSQAASDFLEAVRRDTEPTSVRPLIFSDRVEPDGTVTGNVHVIPAGTRRIYAAFESVGELAGLEHVLAVWRDPSDDRMVFTEVEPVRTGSVYNYVWLELDDGWPAGFYQLDLFHPARATELLASRSFKVR